MNCDTCLSGPLETTVSDPMTQGIEHPSGDLLVKILQNSSPFSDRLLKSTFEAVLDDSPSGGWSLSPAKRVLDSGNCHSGSVGFRPAHGPLLPFAYAFLPGDQRSLCSRALAAGGACFVYTNFAPCRRSPRLLMLGQVLHGTATIGSPRSAGGCGGSSWTRCRSSTTC